MGRIVFSVDAVTATRPSNRDGVSRETTMIVSYDTVADAVYIKLDPAARVARTVEVKSETFVDFDARGDVVGIELLNPTPMILKQLAKKYHRPELASIHPEKLHAAVAS